MHPLLNIALKAARKTGDMILSSVDRGETLKISEKAKNNFVTHIDKLAEKMIIDEIRYAYPHHAILGEETGHHQGNQDCWIIDPIDGTTNFIHGLPQFSISIGFKEKDKLTVGLIYDPIKREIFIAEKGGGARLNDKRIRVAGDTKLENAVVAIGMPGRSEKSLNQFMRSLRQVYRECGDMRRGGAASLDLAYVACGRLDAYFEMDLKPWDMAAGALIVNEAGGILTDIDGSQNFLTSGHLIATTPKLYKDIYRIANSGFVTSD